MDLQLRHTLATHHVLLADLAGCFKNSIEKNLGSTLCKLYGVVKCVERATL